MMTGKTLPLAIAMVCVLMSAGAQLSMKVGMSPAGGSPSSVSGAYVHALTNVWVWVGLGLYGLSALAWLWVLSRLDVSVAYPLVSLGFVVTFAAGVLWLGEAWSWQRLLGAGLIVAGVVLLAHDVGRR
jgi:multidrug transporter EmrE-like cation transporter